VPGRVSATRELRRAPRAHALVARVARASRRAHASRGLGQPGSTERYLVGAADGLGHATAPIGRVARESAWRASQRVVRRGGTDSCLPVGPVWTPDTPVKSDRRIPQLAPIGPVWPTRVPRAPRTQLALRGCARRGLGCQLSVRTGQVYCSYDTPAGTAPLRVERVRRATDPPADVRVPGPDTCPSLRLREARAGAPRTPATPRRPGCRAERDPDRGSVLDDCRPIRYLTMSSTAVAKTPAVASKLRVSMALSNRFASAGQ
jgi:hypothetical protein